MIAGTPTFAPTSIGGRTFLGGTVVAGARRRPLAFLELETFAAGRLYKVAARIAGRHGDAALRAIGTALETIAIFAPGAPMPPPARATSPDAPVVAVTAEAPHADSGGETPPAAGRRYVVVRITVANDGAGTYRATPLGFSLVDGDDRAAHAATLGDRQLGAAMLVATDVPPGRRSSATWSSRSRAARPSSASTGCRRPAPRGSLSAWAEGQGTGHRDTGTGDHASARPGRGHRGSSYVVWECGRTSSYPHDKRQRHATYRRPGRQEAAVSGGGGARGGSQPRRRLLEVLRSIGKA